jgi:5-hydroxyisourate hydrolase-like protein (transthyretin family)
VISTHVLDTARGHPAEGVPVMLEHDRGHGWQELARASSPTAATG